MIHMKKIVFSIVATTLIISLGYGGAWPQKRFGGFFKLSELFLVSERALPLQGRLEYMNYITNFYGEFGVTNNFTVGAYIPYFYSTATSLSNYNLDDNTSGGLGDMELLLRKGLSIDPVVISLELVLGIPAGSGSGLFTTGDGEFNALLNLKGGISLYPIPMFAGVSLGYNLRSLQFSDHFRGEAEVGYTFFKDRFTLIAKAFTIHSIKNREDASIDIDYINNLDATLVGLEGFVRVIEGFGITANYFHSLKEVNTLLPPYWSLGVYLNL